MLAASAFYVVISIVPKSLQLIYNEARQQGLSDVRGGKAHEHKKVGVIEKFLVNVVLYYLCTSDGPGTQNPKPEFWIFEAPWRNGFKAS